VRGLFTRYSSGQGGRTVLLLIAILAIDCFSAHAQDQQTLQPAQPPQTSQQQPAQTQTPENPTPQSQPSQSQASQDQTPQSAAPQNQPAPDKQNGDQNPPQGTKEKTRQVTVQAADATKKFGEATLYKITDWERGWLTGPYVGKNRELVPMTAEQRRQIYLQQTFTVPSDYFKRMFSAAVDQMRDSPSQWPEGWEGYGERFASREGQFIAANSLAAWGDSLLKYEPRYDQCKCSGFTHRTRHAILRNFLTYDQSERQLRPQWALYGGAFGGGLISTAWKPRPQSLLRNAGFGMLGQAGYGALLNFFTEFAGDINRKIDAKIGRR
jgi:hypothetical protein